MLLVESPCLPPPGGEAGEGVTYTPLGEAGRPSYHQVTVSSIGLDWNGLDWTSGVPPWLVSQQWNGRESQEPVEPGKISLFRTFIKVQKSFYLFFIMHPAQPSEGRLGGVHFNFRHIQICTRLLQCGLFKVTMYTAHIGWNGSLFLTARFLVYWTYKVSS